MQKPTKDTLIYENLEQDSLSSLRPFVENYRKIDKTNINELINVETLERILKAYESIIKGYSLNTSQVENRRILYADAARLVYECLLKAMIALGAKPVRIHDNEAELEIILQLLSTDEGDNFNIENASNALNQLKWDLPGKPSNRLEAIENVMYSIKKSLLMASLRDMGALI